MFPRAGAARDGERRPPAWAQWQWMSQYRVWEANREVFLWPENWIDPTLRHDASPFFTELMQDLKQGDLTTDLVDVSTGTLGNHS